MRGKLDSVQRGFARRFREPCSAVSLNSVLARSGILPLDLHIQEAVALYNVRRGSSRYVPGDGETGSAGGFAEAPHPATQMPREFMCLADVQKVQICIDGGGIGGKVGAALFIRDNDGEVWNLNLSHVEYCTICQVELLAICKAIKVILARQEGGCGLYGDSMSSLLTLADHSSLHPLAVRARAKSAKALHQDKAVTLFWIKAHAGLPGNERADELAGEAALSYPGKPDYDQCPISSVGRQIRLDTLDWWNRRYVSGEAASVTGTFLPDAIVTFRIVQRARPMVVLRQVLAGRGGFSKYSNYFECKESPSGLRDPSVAETAQHILVECPLFTWERYQLECVLDGKQAGENLHGFCVQDRESFNLLHKSGRHSHLQK